VYSHGDIDVGHRPNTNFAKHPPNAFLSIMSAVVMMMGDWQFVQTYGVPYVNGQLYYPTLNFIFLILFIILMPILFINLLVSISAECGE
jgi:uncharacterized membrane protein YidH (DUF202 family)